MKFGIGAAATLVASGAAAQTVTLAASYTPVRLLPDGGTWGYRSAMFNPTSISYADCEADIALQFNVTLTGFTGAQYLQAWASKTGDCTTAAARGNPTITSQTCWPLGGQLIPGQAEPGKTISVYARDLARFVGGLSDNTGGQLGTVANETYPGTRPESWCHNQTQDLGVPIVITFAIENGDLSDITGAQDQTFGSTSSTSGTTAATPPFVVDVLAPQPPAITADAGIEDTALLLYWGANDPGSGNPYSQQTSEVAGFIAFMDPIPGASPDGGLADGATAGVDAEVVVSWLACDAGFDGGWDGGVDSGFDSGFDSGLDAGFDGGSDDASGDGAAVDAGADGSFPDAGAADATLSDSGADATTGDGAATSDAGVDSGGIDAGYLYPPLSLWDGGPYPAYCHRFSSSSPPATGESLCIESTLLANLGAGTTTTTTTTVSSDAGASCVPNSVTCSTTTAASITCSDAGIAVTTRCAVDSQICVSGLGCTSSCTTGSSGCQTGGATAWTCPDGGIVLGGSCGSTGTSDGGAVGSDGGIINSSYNNAGQPGLATPTGLYVQSNLVATATQMQVKGLTDGVSYNYAIAVVDTVGNIGPLSTQACQTPQEVNDFWTLYVDAGGMAGGGFCSVEAPGAARPRTQAVGGESRRWPVETTVFGICVFGALGAFIRRRRGK